MSKFLIRHSEAVEVGLKASVDVPLYLHEHIVQGAGISRTADTTSKWAVEARIRSLEEVVDLAKCDETRMACQHESAGRSPKALDQTRMRK